MEIHQVYQVGHPDLFKLAAWFFWTVGMQRRISSCPPQLALEHLGIRRTSRLEKLRETARRLYSNTSVTWAQSAHHTKSERLYPRKDCTETVEPQMAGHLFCKICGALHKFRHR